MRIMEIQQNQNWYSKLWSSSSIKLEKLAHYSLQFNFVVVDVSKESWKEKSHLNKWIDENWCRTHIKTRWRRRRRKKTNNWEWKLSLFELEIKHGFMRYFSLSFLSYFILIFTHKLYVLQMITSTHHNYYH